MMTRVGIMMLVMVASMTVMDNFENEQNKHVVPLEAHAYSAVLKMGKISMMPLGG